MNSKLVIFVIACALGVGAILVFAKNNMNNQKPTDQTQDSVSYSATASSAPSPVSNQFGGTTQVAGAQTQNQQPQTQNTQQQNQAQAQTQNQAQGNTQQSNPIPTGPITELMVREIAVGNGAEVKTGDTVEVNYLGTFMDGRKFDSSYDHGQTFSFTVGAGNVIKGWDQGLVGMKVGGKRQLIIPSDLAYGAAGAPGAIPPNTPLAFEIELIAIK